MKISPIWRRCALVTLLALAFLLRSCGISHDLDEGNVYHPDTPKQIYATQLFLNGDYYFQTGNINYDGYPYLNSHLIEFITRAIVKVGNATCSHIGLHTPFPIPDRPFLFWLTRLFNVTLSTLTVFIVYLIGRRVFSTRAGLLGALLATFSPVAVITCHEAMSDTTAIFFTITALFFALRIYDEGRMIDYVAAAVATAFAFSAKYHGGMAFLPCAIAHLMRFKNGRQIFTRPSLSRIMLYGVAGIIGFCIATPAFLIAPDDTIKNIVTFFQYTSNFGMSQKLTAMSLPVRWWFGLRHNIPDFFQLLSPVIFALLLPGIVWGLLRKRQVIILMAMPFLYIFLALPFKPLTHPQYHGMVIPLFFVMTGGILVRLFTLKKFKPLPQILATLCILSGSFLLVRETYETNFYYQRRDTRQLAHYWLTDNIPSSFQIAAGHYTLPYTPQTVETPTGRLMFSSVFRPHKQPDNVIFTTHFDLKDNAFELFRNPAITAYTHNTEWLRKEFTPPIYQHIPSPHKSDVILTSSVNFYRTPSHIHLVNGEQKKRFIFSDIPIKNALFLFKNGMAPIHLRASAGGATVKRTLRPCETAYEYCIPKRRVLKRQPGRHVYELNAKVRGGDCLLIIALTDTEKGVALFQSALYAEALPHLLTAFKTRPSPTIAAMIRHCECVVNAQPSRYHLLAKYADTFFNTEWTAASMLEAYGVSPDYLNALPYIKLNKDDFHPSPGIPGTFATKVIFITPGAYRLTASATANINVLDARTGRILPLDADSIFRATTATPCVRVSATALGRAQIQPAPIESLKMLQSLNAQRQPGKPANANECSVRFSGGIEMTGYRLRSPSKPNSECVLNTYWRSPPSSRLSGFSVWVHFVNARGETMFQGDRPLLNEMTLRCADGLVTTPPHSIRVPPETPPGTYSVKIGLYIPLRKTRVNIRKSSLPTEKDGAILGTVKIERSEN